MQACEVPVPLEDVAGPAPGGTPAAYQVEEKVQSQESGGLEVEDAGLPTSAAESLEAASLEVSLPWLSAVLDTTSLSKLDLTLHDPFLESTVDLHRVGFGGRGRTTETSS